VAACRAPLLDPLDDADAQAVALAAASAAYKAALSHPRLGATWVEGWREWGEVLWLQGKRAAACKCLEMVLERFGGPAGRLGPATTVRGEGSVWMARGKRRRSRRVSEVCVTGGITTINEIYMQAAIYVRLGDWEYRMGKRATRNVSCLYVLCACS
jgi:hypothetical protein